MTHVVNYFNNKMYCNNLTIVLYCRYNASANERSKGTNMANRQTTLAALAPLSAPMIDKLVALHLRRFRGSDVGIDPAAIEAAAQRADEVRKDMIHSIQSWREQAYQAISACEPPRIRTGDAHRLAREWGAIGNTGSFHRRIQQGTLRNRMHGVIDPHTLAAVLIASKLGSCYQDVKARTWLPTNVSADEPVMWLWCQMEPDGHPEPVPDTQLADLPPHALLWTPWCGVLWDEGWQEGEGVGAARLAGGLTEEARSVWGLAAGEEIVGLVQRLHGGFGT
jgi:hypothetical protein